MYLVIFVSLCFSKLENVLRSLVAAVDDSIIPHYHPKLSLSRYFRRLVWRCEILEPVSWDRVIAATRAITWSACAWNALDRHPKNLAQMQTREFKSFAQNTVMFCQNYYRVRDWELTSAPMNATVGTGPLLTSTNASALLNPCVMSRLIYYQEAHGRRKITLLSCRIW